MAKPTLDHHRGGRGEPMVLIHGIGSTWRVWKPVLGALEARHDVIALSLPGCGESPPASGPVTAATLADDVGEALDALGVGDAHVVGNSLGGWTGAELARRGRALSLVAISPAGLWTEGERRWLLRSLRTSRSSHRACPIRSARG